MTGFIDFVSTELPKRPFTSGDGAPGQILVRSTNLLAVRELVWADAPGATASGFTAAETISGHQAFVLDADGRALIASADIASHQFVEALSLNAAALGDPVQAVRTGMIEHLGWAFEVGRPVFLGLAGAIVQTPPPGALFSKVLGVAVSANRVKLDFQPAIFF